MTAGPHDMNSTNTTTCFVGKFHREFSAHRILPTGATRPLQIFRHMPAHAPRQRATLQKETTVVAN